MSLGEGSKIASTPEVTANHTNTRKGARAGLRSDQPAVKGKLPKNGAAVVA